MLIRCGYSIGLHLDQPVTLLQMLAVHPFQPDGRLLWERHGNSRGLLMAELRAEAGNRCHRLVAPAGPLTLTGETMMRCPDTPDHRQPSAREMPVAQLPPETLVYLLASRYCETDKLGGFAWDMFGRVAPGWCRVQAICDFVHRHVRFGYGHASPTRTASETLNDGEGVCRDFAHLAISLCRCLNIPARYVNGHLGDIGVPVVEPMDFSAWMEVYLDGAWHVFDPRNNAARIGRIIIARGRDAADVPLIHSFGPHRLQHFRVWTFEEPATPRSGNGWHQPEPLAAARPAPAGLTLPG